MTVEALSEALAARDLIAEGTSLVIDPGPAENSSPWYVQVMLGVCAWIAGLLLLVFVVLAVASAFRGSDSWGLILVLGLMACGGSALIYAAVKEGSAFGTQFALAMSIAGQTAVTVGLGGAGGPQLALWALVGLEIALVIAVRNNLHRTLTSSLAVTAFALAMHASLFHDLPGLKFTLNGGRSSPTYDLSLVSVVLWLALWGPVAFLAFWLVKNEARWMAEGREALLRPVTYGVVAALAVAPLATHPATFWLALGLEGSRDLTDGSTGATALWPLLAMFLAILALALGFTLRNRALMGLAILFGLLEIGGFYYVLGTTLLIKSVVMVVFGVILLSVAQALAKEPAA